MRSRGDVWRESIVLVVTAISCAGLLGAGAFFWSNGSVAGHAALARLSGEVANSVAVEWEHLRREDSWLRGDLLRWTREPGPAPPPVFTWPQAEANLVVDALLSEVQRRQLSEGDSEGALTLLVELLEKGPTEEQLALARLQIIQLGVRHGRRALVQETLSELRQQLGGAEARGETSILLLAGLAATPVLEASERLALQEDLVRRWQAGELALPAATRSGNPLRRAFRMALQQVAANPTAEQQLEQAERAERAREIARELGQPLPIPAGEELAVQAMHDEELIYRRLGPDLLEGRFMPAGSSAAALDQHVASSGVLPEGFVLDLGAQDGSAGTLVRDWTALEYLDPGFRLRHQNPAGFAADVEDQQRLLSAGFFLLALSLAVAGLVLSRSIRRERHLARLKSLFVANVSHELRTPVASILLMAENLEAGRVPEAQGQGRYHRLIRQEADRLRRLVNDVLDFSRIEQGKPLQMAVGSLDLQAFACELEQDARERTSAAGAELDFHCDGKLTTLFADGDALRRACMNLVENALRHSGQLDVQVQLEGDGQGGLVLRVSDSGRGVPAARLESLFEPFERVEELNGPRSAAAGTGLGLAIVREIAESHGGEVRAQDRTPLGFAVEIHIPLNSRGTAPEQENAT